MKMLLKKTQEVHKRKLKWKELETINREKAKKLWWKENYLNLIGKNC